MVSRLFLIFFLSLTLSGFASATPLLKLVVDKTEVQIGHHINATLYGIDLPTNLSEIDTRALNENFGISILESSEGDADTLDNSWLNRNVQILQLSLYPRRLGALSIPALNFAGTHSQAQTIQATHSIKKSRLGNTIIERELSVSTRQPWERQQVYIELTITSPEKFVSLRTETPKITGFEVFTLPTQNEQTERNGIHYTRVRSGWILFPLSAGAFTLDLPAIEYRQSGRTLRTFYLPKQELTVQALPPYIPPTMPVGNIQVSATLDADRLLFPDTLYYWNLSLTGTGVSPHWLPPVMRQIKSNDDVRFLPKDSQQQLAFTRSDLQSQVTHRIPFKANTNGKLPLPKLRIQFFDPDSGKIETINYQQKTPFVLSISWRIFIAATLSLLLLRLGYLAYKNITHSLKRHQLRQVAFQKIKTATNIADIRKALNILSTAENWPTNMTLREWAQHWKNQYIVDKHFDIAFDKLSQACYQTNRPTDIKALRATIFQQLLHN